MTRQQNSGAGIAPRDDEKPVALCPRCKFGHLYRDPLRWWDWPGVLVGVKPYRCDVCHRRFHQQRLAADSPTEDRAAASGERSAERGASNTSKLSELEKQLLLTLLHFARHDKTVDCRFLHSLHSFGGDGVSQALARLEARGILLIEESASSDSSGGGTDRGGGQVALLPTGRIVAELIEVKEQRRKS